MLSIADAALQLGIGTEDLATACRAGRIFGFRDGDSWKFTEHEVERYRVKLGQGGFEDSQMQSVTQYQRVSPDTTKETPPQRPAEFDQIERSLNLDRATGAITQAEYEERLSALRLVASDQVSNNEDLDFEIDGSTHEQSKQISHDGHLKPGVVIENRWTLKEQIGRGGMGLVWKVVDAHLMTKNQQGFIVLKFLRPEEQGSEDAISRTLGEFQAVRRLRSKHICPIHDFRRHPRFGCFLVMDFIDGITLKQYSHSCWARGEAVSAKSVAKVVTAIGSALQEAHDAGVVHRDIKPDNILIDRKRQIQLIDFGLARELEHSDGTSRGFVARGGTPPYMAPEQLKEEKQSAESDQYSLAVVAWELLTGSRPFVHGDTSLLLQAMNNNSLPDVGLNPRVMTVMRRALSPDRNSRHPSVLAFTAILRDVLLEDSTAALVVMTEVDRSVPTRQAERGKQSTETKGTVDPKRARMRAIQKQWAEQLQMPVELTNGLGMQFRLVPPGSLRMGSDVDELAGLRSRVDVSITHPILFAVYPVTQAEWTRVMGSNPSQFKFVKGQDTSLFPVESVSWIDCQRFLERLHSVSRLEGWAYRLPTEAEWEHGCRAGTDTTFEFGDFMNGTNGNCNGRQPYPSGTAIGPNLQRPTPVGNYEPNALGLYEMHGNVWEWCSDWYTAEPPSVSRNPPGPTNGKFRVVRGGAWDYDAYYCRSAARDCRDPSTGYPNIGIRIACELVETK